MSYTTGYNSDERKGERKREKEGETNKELY